MKLSILILLFLFLTSFLFADLHGQLEFGKTLEDTTGYATILLMYDFDIAKINIAFLGGWLTWFESIDGKITFAPFQDIYSIGAQIALFPFYVKIKHFCNHPVFSGYAEREKLGETLTAVSIGFIW